MLDRFTLPLIKKPLLAVAKGLKVLGVSANQVTLFGFVVGLLALPALAFSNFKLALLLIVLNRILDGVDGELARLTQGTDQGAFLDIVLDFVFYSAVVFGFALAMPEQNALPAAALIFGFMGTGASFLAFSIFAERRNIVSLDYPNKGLYYMGGLAEGTETIAFFVLFCVLPGQFALLAWIFAAICYLSAALRIWAGYRALS